MSWMIDSATGLPNPFVRTGYDDLQPGFRVTEQGVGGAVSRFEEAMRAASGVEAPAPVQVAQVQGVGSVTDAVPLAEVTPAQSGTAPGGETAEDRAARGLDIAAEPGPGTAILDGLGRLRGIFDAQTQNVLAVGQRDVMDAATLMALQTEVVRYTVLVDVSSKLAGKSTQALDALMKGQ